VLSEVLPRHRIGADDAHACGGAQPQDKPGEAGEPVLVARRAEVRAGEETMASVEETESLSTAAPKAPA
jgi:hypothetical protein